MLVSDDPDTTLSFRSTLLQKQALELELMFDFALGATVHSCRGNVAVLSLSLFVELHCGRVSSKSHSSSELMQEESHVLPEE